MGGKTDVDKNRHKPGESGEEGKRNEDKVKTTTLLTTITSKIKCKTNTYKTRNKRRQKARNLMKVHVLQIFIFGFIL